MRNERKNQKSKCGLSLIEVLIATILVGLAITALLAANRSFTMANGAGTDLTTAEFLIEQIRELTTLLSYDDLYTLDDSTFTPPINANKVALSDFAAFSQQVTVENINPANFEQVVTDHSSSFVRVTVKVLLNSREISSEAWIRAQY